MEYLESLKLALSKKRTTINYSRNNLKISEGECLMTQKMNLAYQVIGTKENAQKLYARLIAI